MKTLLRIKWETIITLMLLATTIYGWYVYFKYATEVKMLAMATITTFLYVMVLFSYKTIRDFRKEVLKMWQ